MERAAYGASAARKTPGCLISTGVTQEQQRAGAHRAGLFVLLHTATAIHLTSASLPPCGQSSSWHHPSWRSFSWPSSSRPSFSLPLMFSSTGVWLPAGPPVDRRRCARAETRRTRLHGLGEAREAEVAHWHGPHDDRETHASIATQRDVTLCVQSSGARSP